MSVCVRGAGGGDGGGAEGGGGEWGGKRHSIMNNNNAYFGSLNVLCAGTSRPHKL